MDYKKLIEDRQSCREFDKKVVKEDAISALQSYFAEAHRLGDDKLDMKLVTGKDAGKRLEGVVGYQGFAFNAPLYLVFMGNVNDSSYVGAGFTVMDMALKAGELGVDSCFLTVDDSKSVKKALQIEGELDVLSILACGYGKRESLAHRIDIINNSKVNTKKREGYVAPKIALSDMVYENEWGNPADLSDESELSVMDEAFWYASLAPSFLNKQNYRYFIKGGKVAIFRLKDEEESREDALLSIGCTMFNFFITYSGSYRDGGAWSDGALEGFEAPEEYEMIGSISL